ncbi:MAG: TerC family protein [Gammaproteobacteria bacterium]|jgi:predicted tellurium resistance membrane protein TerC|nr:TerC family protein [Gammaproteobacteria bacterium]MBP6050533.1 TerC family protein [Pseudomonadales bacterium]MBK6583381.1 TerC family protein [Gammaproteobacteria bacterium]MBK7521155.1 TerC family protein [Gammaproteobacteria bacterium]MBK7728930.1 TerC family protein [Gammaproteobacteria bacterium]
MFEWMSSPEAWVALGTLTALEIVLGIDNIVFLSILVGRLPPEQRDSARILGLALAMLTRIALLLSIAWVSRLTKPLFVIPLTEEGISGRDIVLVLGGLFLLFKATSEIHSAVEGAADDAQLVLKHAAYIGTLVQIAIIDIVFSLDSVITAVGMARDIPVMVLAVIAAVLVMMFAARPLGEFIENHPTVKVLALAFLVMIGTALIAEGFDYGIPKPYLYVAMAFSLGVEVLNIRLRRNLGSRA